MRAFRLSCTASAAARCIFMSTGKMAARKRLSALQTPPAQQAGRCWPSTCPNTERARDRPEQLLPWAVVPEIQAVYARMQPVWPHIRLYGVSIGAWLAMQALRAEKLEKALLVSPVVDMETLILSMMQGAHVTEEQLKAAGEIPTEMGETLSWPYLCWAREHPLQWHTPTQVLYGDKDALTSRAVMERFRRQSGAHLTILQGGEHWFHTSVQMAAVQTWEEANL